MQVEVARAGEERGREIASEIKRRNGGGDFLGRGGAHAGAPVEHAIDRRQRDAGGAGDVVHGGPAAWYELGTVPAG